MATLTQKKLLTAEEFFQLPEPIDGSQQELVRGEVITMTPRRPALEQLEGIAGQALVAAKAVGAPMRAVMVADTVAANSADRIGRKSAKAANTSGEGKVSFTSSAPKPFTNSSMPAGPTATRRSKNTASW